MAKTIGVIGLGTMGGPMARNLLKAGYEVTVYNRNPERARAFEGLPGAQVAASLAEVAERADVILTMLADNNAVEAVYLGPGGLRESLVRSGKKSLALIDSSTIAPEMSIRIADALAEEGIDVLDAPVTGSEPQAIEGVLTFMVGGRRETFEACREILLAMGKKALYIGPSGSGSRVKLANNSLVAITLLGVAESIRMMDKSGIDPALFLEVVAGGGARSGMAEMKGPMMLQGDYKPAFMTKLMHKDLGLALQLTESLGLSVPMLETAKRQFLTAVENGTGDEDMSSVYKLY